MTPHAALDQGIARLALSLPAGAPASLLKYLTLLSKWNRTYNLTAIRDPLAMVAHHLLHSLAVVPHLPFGARARIADPGCGGGLPRLRTASGRRDWHVALAQSGRKTGAFLRQATSELALASVEVHEGGVEAWRPRPLFDLVISRAFG